nr:hypothetical protein [Tanacetum cinerariifolium]
RGPGRDRRHRRPRKGHRAGGGETPESQAGRIAEHARDADPRRRLLRAAGPARGKGAQGAGRFVRLDPRRRLRAAERARLL